MAGRPSKNLELAVWMNGDLVGTWSGAGNRFRYAGEWLHNPLCRSLSLSLPLPGDTRCSGPLVESFFDNLLPDNEAIRRRLATKYGVGTGTIDLLAEIGRDCVGAIQLLPMDAPRPDVRRIDAEPLSDEAVAHSLDRTVSSTLSRMNREGDLRISLAGAQEKTAFLWHEGQWCHPQGATPTTHIFKLPLGKVGDMQADFSTSVENEWLCARIIEAYGLPVAKSEIHHFGHHKALVVERFDRQRMQDGWWARLPQEDFCQALGVSSSRKYESDGGPGMAHILTLLRGSENAEVDRRHFLTAQLMFWMLAAPDGHAKNFSVFLLSGDRFRLTPLYDVMSAWPIVGRGAGQMSWKKIKLAMAVRGKNAHYEMAMIRRRHWNTVAKNNALGDDFEDTIKNMIGKTPDVVNRVQSTLPTNFPAAVSDTILDGLQRQANILSRG